GVREVAPEAVAAIDRTTAGGDQQGAAAVLLDHPVARTCGAIADRVQAETRHRPHLRVQWQDLAQQRIARVSDVHPADEAAWHPQWKLGQRGVGNPQTSRVQPEDGEQLRRVAHRLAPELLPAWRGQGDWLRAGRGCGYHSGPVLL